MCKKRKECASWRSVDEASDEHEVHDPGDLEFISFADHFDLGSGIHGDRGC